MGPLRDPPGPAPRPPGRLDPRSGLGLLAFLCLLYVPFAGAYGLWDPWESHYGEVARQMVERNDWISLWWPGSPQDPPTFWSKPVLTFWLMALSLKLFGLGRPGLAHAAEMTQGWTAEWALRLPFVLLGVAGVWAVFELVRRTAGRTAALWSAVLLGTAAQWALISRQAMTDMAFVTPMTVAVCYAGLALLLPDAEVRRDLPRRALRLGRLHIDWPRDRAFYALLALYVGCVLPQLVVYAAQLDRFTFTFGGRSYRAAGILGVLPFLALFAGSLAWLLRARDRRAIYLQVAYVMAGLATLAKGPAGLAMPLLALLLYLLLAGRLRELLRLELVRGGLVFLCTAAPWYAVMVLRHGAPFWMELIGDNYVRRAQGRHGDRGTFEYYLRQLAAGLFPWTGVVAAALGCCRRWLGGPRRGLVLLCLCWLVVDFMVVSLVNTKFHHYILPALPPLCVLGGLLLEELLEGEGDRAPARDGAVGLVLLGLPLLWLAGRDLSAFPARIGWLFNYDYVNAPGTGRPWPASSIYGHRYEYGGAVLAFTVAAVALLGLLAQRALRPGPMDVTAPAPAPAGGEARGPSPWPRVAAFLLLLAVAMAAAPGPELVAQWSSSKVPPEASLPARLRLAFLVPAAAAGLWLLGLLRAGGLLRAAGRRGLRAAALGLALVAVVFSAWVLDRFLVDISPHWSQKHVFATYYRLRTGPGEPVVAWYMYWRGENFYTRNQIYDPKLPSEDKTVFLGDNHTEKLKAYVESHRGRRIFFVFERHRLELLRSLLPPEARASLQVVDESNNKVYLAVASL